MSDPVRSEQFTGSFTSTFWVYSSSLHIISVLDKTNGKLSPSLIFSPQLHTPWCSDISLYDPVIMCKSFFLLSGKWGLSPYWNEVMLSQLHTERADWGQQRFVHLRNCQSTASHSVFRLCVYNGIKPVTTVIPAGEEGIDTANRISPLLGHVLPECSANNMRKFL